MCDQFGDGGSIWTLSRQNVNKFDKKRKKEKEKKEKKEKKKKKKKKNTIYHFYFNR